MFRVKVSHILVDEQPVAIFWVNELYTRKIDSFHSSAVCSGELLWVSQSRSFLSNESTDPNHALKTKLLHGKRTESTGGTSSLGVMKQSERTGVLWMDLHTDRFEEQIFRTNLLTEWILVIQFT